MVTKARVLSAIMTQNYQDRVNGREFVRRMIPTGQRMLADCFALWRKNLSLARQDDMAELFYGKRAAKFLLRKCFDRLRVGARNYVKKDAKD